MAPLFSVLRKYRSRRSLCQSFAALAARAPQYADAAEFLTNTNSWLADVLDSPDYCKRVAAYNKAADIIQRATVTSAEQRRDVAAAEGQESGSMDVDESSDSSQLDEVLCIAAIHQSAYILVNVKHHCFRSLFCFAIMYVCACTCTLQLFWLSCDSILKGFFSL